MDEDLAPYQHPQEAYEMMLNAMISAIEDEKDGVAIRHINMDLVFPMSQLLLRQFPTIKEPVVRKLLAFFSLFKCIALLELIRRGEEQLLIMREVLSLNFFPRMDNRRLTNGTANIFTFQRGVLPDADEVWARIQEIQKRYLEVFNCPVCMEDFVIDDSVGCRDREKGTGDSSVKHRFCTQCVEGQAKACITEAGVAVGGIGLKCLQPDCKGHLPWAHIRTQLDEATEKQLVKRLDHEALLNMEGIEKCRKCDFMILIESTREEDPFFICQNDTCNDKFCRSCKKDYERHFGKGCKEMETDEENARKKLEEQLTAALIRKCPSCHVEFQKDHGCNKMTCRCGVTQCYLCRASYIDYSHFGAGKCDLHSDYRAVDVRNREQAIAEGRQTVDAHVLNGLL